MKVLLVNKFNYLKGGAAKYFLDLADLLEENGTKVAKFSMCDPKNVPGRDEKYFVSNINFNNFRLRDIFKYAGRVLYSRESAKKFGKLLHDFKPDIIHLHNFYHHISPSIIPVAKKFGVPVVMHLHDYKIICPNYKLYSQGEICHRCKGGKYYNCLKRRCLKGSLAKSFLAMLEAYFHNTILETYKKIDLFIAPSRFMKDICVEFGVPKEKIRILHNFVDTRKFLKNYDENQKEDYLLYFGRLSDEKGVGVAISAMKKVNSDLKLKIVGIGPEEEKLKALIKKNNLEGKIEIVGAKYGEVLVEIIKRAKAVVIPSVLPENMPLGMLEAMAGGKVVIASNAGGIIEIISDEENGFLFSPGDSGDLARKINGLEKFNLAEISKKAYQKVSKLDRIFHHKEINDIYQKILETQID